MSLSMGLSMAPAEPLSPPVATRRPPAKRRRRPQLTRTKTGCFGCRLRRKKCDEHKPVCHGCSQNRLLCSWPKARATEAENAKFEFAWRRKFLAGERVSEDSPIEPTVTVTESTSLPHSAFPLRSRTPAVPDLVHKGGRGRKTRPDGRDPPSTFSTCFSVVCKPPGHTLISDAISGHFFDFYLNYTCPRMFPGSRQHNPYSRLVGPFAHDDKLIMACVLCLAGAHLSYQTASPEMLHKSSQYYATALRELRPAITSWVSGARQDTARLFLATILLVQRECIMGNRHGEFFQHLRAGYEFAKHAVDSSLAKPDAELLAFCVEVYAYFTLLGGLRGYALGAPPESLHQVPRLLMRLERSEPANCMFGYGVDLYLTIPTIAELAMRWNQDRRAYGSPQAREQFSALQATLLSWRAPELPRDEENCPDRVAAIGAGMILQNVLLIVLYLAYHQGHVEIDVLVDSLNSIVSRALPLFDLVEGTAWKEVTFVPMMVLACCTRSAEHQRLIWASLAVSNDMDAFPIQGRAREILSWIWSEPASTAFGLVGLERVLRERHAYMTVG